MFELRVRVMTDNETSYGSIGGPLYHNRHGEHMMFIEVRGACNIKDQEFSMPFSPVKSDFDRSWEQMERLIREHFRIHDEVQYHEQNQELLERLEQLEARNEQLEEENESLADDLSDERKSGS